MVFMIRENKEYTNIPLTPKSKYSLFARARESSATIAWKNIFNDVFWDFEASKHIEYPTEENVIL